MGVHVLHALAAETSTGTGSRVDIGAGRDVEISVRVTAGSGPLTAFRVWLEQTFDGTNYFEVACRRVLKGGDAAPGAASLDERDIVNETSIQTSGKWVAVADRRATQVRVAWFLSGATPSETFEVLAAT